MSITNINAGQAVVKIIGDNTELRQMLEQQTTDLDKFARKWTNIGARLQAAGQLLFAPFQEAMGVFAQFDDQMRRVAAVSGATGKAFAELTTQAKALGASTAFTASQVAAGMASLGMMGFSPTEINGAMESVMALSRATSTDLAEAATIAANQLRVFGLSAADTEKVADILAATANGSAQTLTDLGEALKMAGPLAKVTGQDLKQVSAALGVLANMGIRGSMAGTAIARSYKQMAIPKVQEHLRGLGVEVLDVNGNLRNMAEIWADLGKKLATMTNADQLATLKEVFNDRGILGGGVLSFNPQAIDEFMAKLKQCDGYVSDAAEKMEDGLGGALRNLSSAWEAVKISIGEAASALAPLIRLLSAIARGLAAVIRWTGPLVPILTALTAVLTAVGGAMSAAGMAASVYSLTIGKVLTPAMLANIKFQVQFVALLAQEKFAALAAAGGNTFLATSLAVLKVAAWGTLAAMKALWAVIMAHPLTAILAAITAVAYGLNALSLRRLRSEVDETVEHAQNFEDTEAQKRKGQDNARADTRTDFERLKELAELAKQGQLTATQMQYAQKLADRLAAAGHSNVATLDAQKGSVTLSGTAQADFDAKENEKEKAEVTKRIQARIREMAQVKAELEEALKWRLFGRSDEIKAEAHRLEDTLKELEAAQEEDTDRFKELARQKKAAAEMPAVSREQEARALEIEKQLADERLTQVQKEIQANEDLRKELLEVYEAQLKVAEAKGDTAAANGIRSQIAAANAQFDERAKGIVAKGAKSAGVIDVSADQQKRSEARAKATAEARQERQLEALRDSSPAAYQQRLQELITDATDAVRIAAQALSAEQTKATAADSDGGRGITEAEKAAIDAQRELYEEAQKHLDKLQGKLDEVQTDPQALASNRDHSFSAGSFSVRSLSRMIGGNSVQEKIADATRRTAEYLFSITQLNRRKLAEQKELNKNLGTPT